MRPKLTYANVMATIAVFIALGGASYAATQLPKNSVGTKQLKNGAVTKQKIANAAQKAFAGKQGLPGAPGPKGDAGPVGPSSILSLTKNSPTDLSETGLTSTNIATLTGIPAGKYLITAELSIVNFGLPDYLRCNLRVGTTVYPGATVSAGVNGVANLPVGHLTTSAPVDLADTTNATLQCSHDENGTKPYVDPGMRITAIRTGDLVTQTAP
jgi:hypothetical protein